MSTVSHTSRRHRRRLAASALCGALIAVVLWATPSAGVESSRQRDRCYVSSAFEAFLDRAPTGAERSGWIRRFSLRTPRDHLPSDLAASDEWLATEISDLFRQALGREPDPGGLQFWISEVRGGAALRHVAARVYASPEFFATATGTAEGFVAIAYERILGRDVDSGGLEFWVDELDDRGRTGVATALLASAESRAGSVDDLYGRLLGRRPDADGRAYWAERLSTIDDVALATSLAASAEFYALAQQGCDIPRPGSEWETAPPAEHGMEPALLEEARAYAFSEGRHTQGVVVVHDGAVVSEWYAEGEDAESWAASWSMAKSFTSALVGIAIDDGLIPGVDEAMTTYYPQWAGTDRADITLGDVLTMASGLAWNENYSPDAIEDSDILELVLFREDQLAYAASRPAEVPAGSRWNYSSGDTMLLSGVIEQATGMTVGEYARQELFDPLGISQVEWWRDAAGHTLTYCCLDMTSRGYARLGQLYLNDGTWGSEQVVPSEWVHKSLEPSDAYSGYGYQWWLRGEGPLPDDLFAAQGFDGQYIYVVPSLDLVVVRNSSYVKDPDEAVASPNLFENYPPGGFVPGKGTRPPESWDTTEFLGPIIESVQGG